MLTKKRIYNKIENVNDYIKEERDVGKQNKKEVCL
jgi:hypothetical protein